jgi:hypothetical protein
MQQIPAQHRTGRSSGKRASAYRAASRRPLPRRRRVMHRRTAIAKGRTRRRPLLFYAVTTSVAGELAAIGVGMETLVLLFSLTGLILCVVILQAEKT